MLVLVSNKSVFSEPIDGSEKTVYFVSILYTLCELLLRLVMIKSIKRILVNLIKESRQYMNKSPIVIGGFISMYKRNLIKYLNDDIVDMKNISLNNRFPSCKSISILKE